MSESKEQLEIIALKESIGRIVADYEGQLAAFRAEATLTVGQLNEEIARLTEENENLTSKDG